jgi:phosphohistidine phosphatase SixA
MKRRLIVMRHAKSSWKSDAPNDHARPLNKRGRHDAPRVAARLEELGWLPAHIISSDSARTTETLEHMGLDAQVTFTRDLYHAGIDEVRAAVSPLADDIASVMVVGHNPGWEEVVESLSGEETIMKTACAALLEIEAATWHEAVNNDGGWQLIEMIRPRDLSE